MILSTCILPSDEMYVTLELHMVHISDTKTSTKRGENAPETYPGNFPKQKFTRNVSSQKML